MTRIRIGTRSSTLARVQTQLVAEHIEKTSPQLEVEIVEVQTAGDQDRSTPLSQGSSVGWFTTAIQEALQRGEIDVAVHSYKDLPTRRPAGLVIAAVPLREDPRDALVSRDGKRLRNLKAGARVGTSSPRRAAQVLEIRPDVVVESIRGNVETRIKKVMDGEYDAAVLAYAGLKRLGRESEAAEVFGFEEMLPAPAQGALAIECRTADEWVIDALRGIDDPQLRPLVAAERTFLATLEAGCSFPAAAYAEAFGTTLKLHALVAPEGRIVRSRIGGQLANATELGKALARELMEAGGIRPGGA